MGCQRKKEKSFFTNGSLLEAEMSRGQTNSMWLCVSFTRHFIIWFVFNGVAESFWEQLNFKHQVVYEGGTLRQR